MKIINFFKPKKTLVIILIVLPVIALISAVTLFAACFACYDINDCYFLCDIVFKGVIFILYFSPLICFYLVIALFVKIYFMKNRRFIIGILLIPLSLIFLLLIAYKVTGPSSYALEDIKGDYPIVDSSREAIEVLKQNDQIDYTHLEEIESDVNFEIDWKFYVKQNEDVWSIDLMTVGVVPPHVCSYEMDKYGKPTQDNYLVQCRWIGK